jgi:hypothetical protein
MSPSFITDLDAASIEALTATASHNQASALKDLIYKYLTSRASIGVTIPVSMARYNIQSLALSVELILTT